MERGTSAHESAPQRWLTGGRTVVGIFAGLEVR